MRRHDHVLKKFRAIEERSRVLDGTSGLEHGNNALIGPHFEVAQYRTIVREDPPDDVVEIAMLPHRYRGHAERLGDARVVRIGKTGLRPRRAVAPLQPVILGLLDDAVSVVVEDKDSNRQIMANDN